MNSDDKGVAGFVTKLYSMVDSSPSNLISWSSKGKSFIVTCPETFSRTVLPTFYRHNNFASFVRQLNGYGFHKVPHIQIGGENNGWEFSHPNFQRGDIPSLSLVKRKIIQKENSGSNLPIDFNALLNELKVIRTQQQMISMDLNAIRSDNQMLWNEVYATRARHEKQQEMIDKILRFLASIFVDHDLIGGSNSKNVPTRKRLFIEDSQQSEEMRRKVDELILSTNSDKSNLSQQPLFTLSSANSALSNVGSNVAAVQEQIDPILEILNPNDLDLSLSTLSDYQNFSSYDLNDEKYFDDLDLNFVENGKKE